jgi:hypothetical protein
MLAHVCPVGSLVPALMRLVAESPARPASELAPMVRKLLVEHMFADVSGDSMIGSAQEAQIDKQVERIVAVLEQVRQIGLENGQWSGSPSPPMYFG